MLLCRLRTGGKFELDSSFNGQPVELSESEKFGKCQ